MTRLELLLEHVSDEVIRENFQKLNEFIIEQPVLNAGFKTFEISFSGASTNAKIPHDLGFLPKDIIETSKTGAGTITYNYSSFDKDFLDLTTSAACQVRFLAGSFGTLRVINA